MFQHKDEFLIYSRGGRVPPATRAGPRYPGGLSPADLDALTFQAARDRWTGRGQRVRRLIGAGRPHRRAPERSPEMSGYVDYESYVELEFAVGFAVEDEQWL